jgi:hypothetical protein
VAFLSRLLEASVDVRFADLPEIEGPTGRFICNKWRRLQSLRPGLISKRTRDALAAAKVSGKKLGGNRGVKLTAKARAAGRAEVTARAKARAADIAPTIAEIQAAGATSLRGIAAALSAPLNSIYRPKK